MCLRCFGGSSKADPQTQQPNSRPVEAQSANSTTIKMPDQYVPPPGPPPSHSRPPPANPSEDFAPPPGPPPRQSRPPPDKPETFEPPPGPPPGFHDWQTAVPDTSLLPPPPSLGNQHSSTNNATEREALAGKALCEQNPMTPPTPLPEAALEALTTGNFAVVKPHSYVGDLDRAAPGVWKGKTRTNCPDSCIISNIPLYSVLAHSPLRTGKEKTIYYEVKIGQRNRREVSLALGYAADPYPTFRLPGWHRGCLAVHGDDGSKYVNDMWGGKSFTEPFKRGQSLGIGMTMRARDVNAPPGYGEAPAQTLAKTPINVEIFFTRDGRRGGGWNLHEEGDAQEDLPVDGLEGLNDLYAAVGTFESVEFEIVFDRRQWLYQP